MALFYPDKRAKDDSRVYIRDEAVSKKVLGNGLIILSKSRPPKDLVSIDIKISCGSGLAGEYTASGISHFLEHMVFKGTTTRPVGTIEKEMKSYGGFLNGSVSWDVTDFNVTVPREHFPQALAVLKDMLLNASFDPAEIEKEREVILREISLYKDDPQAMLMRSLYETAYLRHPYKYPVIGYELPLKALKREDLIAYYNRMYVPNRMVIAVVGDVDEEEAISAVEKEFAEFRKPNYTPIVQSREPFQISERRFEDSSKTSLAYMALGFHSTGVLDRDLFATDVLAMILATGDSSRLNSILKKEKALVYSIDAWNHTGASGGLFIILAMLRDENLTEAERVLWNEIEKLKKAGVLTKEELAAAKEKVVASYIFSRQTLEAQAQDLATAMILTGSHDFSRRYIDGVQAVTLNDIRTVAKKYLRRENVTTIILRSRTIEKSIPSQKRLHKSGATEKTVLPNGLVILLKEDTKTPTVSIVAAFRGGLAAEDEKNNGISSLTAGMILKGTKSRQETQIKPQIEDLGGEIDVFSGFDSFGVEISVLSRDINPALELLKDVITDASFPQDELDKAKALVLAAIKEEDGDIFQNGVNIFREELFSPHPYGLRTLGHTESIESLERGDLVKFYRTYYIPNNMVLSIAGDIDVKAVEKKIKDLFGPMGRNTLPPLDSNGEIPKSLKTKSLNMDKDESLILVGFETVPLNDPDRYTFDVLGSVISGQSGRLFAELRDKYSLAYSLGCAQKWSVDTGFLVLYVATTIERVEEARDALFNELKLIGENAVSEEELALAKKELMMRQKINMQTNGFISFQSAIDELYGLGHDNMYKYGERIGQVSKEDIMRIAKKYLDPASYSEVIIRPAPKR